MSTVRNVLSGLFVSVVLLALVVGVVFLRSPVATPGGVDNLSVASTASPAFGFSVAVGQPIGQIAEARECETHLTIYDRVLPTIAQETAASSQVILGPVVSVEPARWNTPDGAPASADKIAATTVYRNVTLSVETSMKGTAGATVTLRVPGGRAGCELFVPDGIPLDIGVGDRLALFVQDLPALDARAVRLPTVVDAWPVLDGATVVTPADGQLSVDAFVTAVKAASSQ